jgi:hypothetical protein
VSHRSLVPFRLTTAVVIASLAGCGDDPTRPDDLARFAEAEAIVRSADALPSLGELAGLASTPNAGQRAVLARAQELWAVGSSLESRRGLAQRRVASGYAAPVLAELIPAEDWIPVRVRVDHWMATAERMTRHLSIPPVDERLGAARGHLARADAATTAHARVYHLLSSMAELVETTPRFVARDIVQDASLAVARATARTDEGRRNRGSEDETLERAQRLADWAGRAAEEGDYVRAIQRAYYAIQLVEDR